MLRPVVAVIALLLLSGCVASGHISNRVDTLNKSVGYSQNQAILLNIVRASRSEPLYFLSISKVGGGASADLRTGLPSLLFGAGVTTADQQYALSNSVGNSTSTDFDLGVLQSQDFYRGLLAQLNLVEANLLIHQGFSRELVFSLLVDRIRVQGPGGARFIRNDPSIPEFDEFGRYLDLAIHYGLTIGTYEARDSSAGRRAAVGQLCFDEALAEPQLASSVRRLRPNCDEMGKAGRSAGDLTVYLDGRPRTLGIVLRSPYQIFRYLGGLLADRAAAARVMVDGAGTGAVAPILVVNAAAGGSCFASVDYAGASYCVPQEGAGNTKRVFDLLNQILALNTSPSDLPATTTIRIAQ